MAIAVVALLAVAGVAVALLPSGTHNLPERHVDGVGGSAARAVSAVRERGEGAPVTKVQEAGAPRGDRLPGLVRPAALEPLTTLPARPAGARVLSSSRTVSGRSTQLTMVARTSRPGSTVIAHYRRALGRHGLVGSPADAAPGSTAVRFVRGTDVVLVTTTRRGGATDVTVFAALHAARTSGRG